MEEHNRVTGKIIGFLAVCIIILIGALVGLDILKQKAQNISAAEQVEQSVVIEQQVDQYFL